MPRVPLAPRALEQPAFRSISGGQSGLTETYSGMYVNAGLAAELARLDHFMQDQSALEADVRLTVALTVAHERDNQPLWDSFEPLARNAGVTDQVIAAIANGTAPRGLLPKDGIWVQFALEVLRDESRDSTWQSVVHLVGDAGAVLAASMTCYYDMMARLNRTLGLDKG